jgi:hypothetical protein
MTLQPEKFVLLWSRQQTSSLVQLLWSYNYVLEFCSRLRKRLVFLFEFVNCAQKLDQISGHKAVHFASGM